jgi:hypothetical protein
MEDGIGMIGKGNLADASRFNQDDVIFHGVYHDR